ncbi:MAG: hypothetical protein DI564_00915 [Rhodanobacter denitrificans]|uniref:PEP-CTERM sorting domain-containing protein n=1 Tax=Rhodanobacter denitrificans TaxID=666685 RepID=A0A2W5KYR4_9GAMM|nr:MAG: hypothetical protein DI564_00915 [Rhodanobacter denitrificans]
MIRRFLFILLLATAGASSAARAAELTWRFDLPPVANMSFLWGWLGDDFGPFTGEVTSTKVVFIYTTEGDQDAADFYFTFDVPTLSDQTWVHFTGKDLGWSGTGTFKLEFNSTDFNGEIRPGRFGAEMTGGGAFTDSYIELTIDGERADPIYFDGFDEKF